MRPVTLAATQMSCSWDRDENIAKAENLVRDAAGNGAQIILLQELFETPYFCQEQDAGHFDLASPMQDNLLISHFAALAKELQLVLPISYFERCNLARYNSLAIVDADGSVISNYRKTHIPQAPGYEEKFYFNPGDTGFQVVQTKFGKIGCGICWDQWYPETARSLVLKGAEILLFPTAIGSEPNHPDFDSSGHWRRTMQGHAAANMVPVVASNRIGNETQGKTVGQFYGTSFIADHTGEILADADRTSETSVVATVDLDDAFSYRDSWGIFRDRRPEMYSTVSTLDGGKAVG